MASNVSVSDSRSRSAALQSYFDRWQQHEPELGLIEPFLPATARLAELCWFSLIHEFEQTMFRPAEPTVSAVKLRWFAQDLAAADGGRHPLAKALFVNLALDAPSWRQLPWSEWAEQALLLSQPGESPADLDHWLAAWQPFAQALAEIESKLLGHRLSASWLTPLLAGRRLLKDLQLNGDKAVLPLSLWLEGGEGSSNALFGAHARARWQALEVRLAPALSLEKGVAGPVRQLQSRHLCRQLRQLCRNGALPESAFSPWHRLWDTWQASRRAAS